MKIIAWWRSLFAAPVVVVKAPAPPSEAELAFRAEADDELVEIDADGRIHAHGRTIEPSRKSNILRDPLGEYGELVTSGSEARNG